MEINISWEKLRKRSLMIATPMYGGQCHGMYTTAMLDLTAMCAHHGIQMQFFCLHNESLITRARNYCVDEFLRSDKTHLLFIDSDIGFDPQSVLQLLALLDHEDPECPYDVIGGAYPKKSISWEKIVAAVNKGFADKDPNELENFVGDFVFNPKENVTEFPIDQPVQVRELGTGFMMIPRRTFEKYKEAYPELSYKPDHVRSKNFDGSREIHAYFDCVIEQPSKRYLSEDYMFCYNVQKMGGQVWLCPWIPLKHAGSYVFGGSIAALAAVGASPTADVNKVSKR